MCLVSAFCPYWKDLDTDMELDTDNDRHQEVFSVKQFIIQPFHHHNVSAFCPYWKDLDTDMELDTDNDRHQEVFCVKYWSFF
jgi:hypothetical protein